MTVFFVIYWLLTITTIEYSSVVYSKKGDVEYMKNYDNYFLPVDNMEEAKRYYEEILG